MQKLILNPTIVPIENNMNLPPVVNGPMVTVGFTGHESGIIVGNQPRTSLSSFVLTARDLNVLLCFNSDYTVHALTSVVGFALARIRTKSSSGFLCDCTFFDSTGENIAYLDLADEMMEGNLPYGLNEEDYDAWCQCTHNRSFNRAGPTSSAPNMPLQSRPTEKCQTCKTADDGIDLYRQILWDCIEQLQFPFHIWPAGYKEGYHVEILGSSAIRVTLNGIQ